MLSLKKIMASITMLVVSPLAMAEAAPAPAGQGVVGQLIFFGGFILIFYFLMWRPQSKRAKEHRELIAGLNKGDEVMLNGGIMGKILRLTDDYLALEISDGVEIKVQKSAIAAALPKGTLKNI